MLLTSYIDGWSAALSGHSTPPSPHITSSCAYIHFAVACYTSTIPQLQTLETHTFNEMIATSAMNSPVAAAATPALYRYLGPYDQGFIGPACATYEVGHLLIAASL